MSYKLPGLLVASALLLVTSGSFAKTTPEKAAALGGPELTPIGAERAGNADGTIPEWTGGITELPEGYEVGGRLVDPFAGDKALFTITAENVDKYADKLTPGQRAMFKRYPDSYRMPVYPTRRSARIPDSEYQLVKEYATKTSLLEGGNGTLAVLLLPFVFAVP